MSDAGKYMIGIDGGTEGLRAGVFDLQGTPLAFATSNYETQFSHPGWAEQNPEDWWTALGKSVREAVSKANVNASQIAAICVDTTCCSVVALDEIGNPLRSAMIWMDVRATHEAQLISQTKHPSLRINNGGKGPLSAEWMIPKALWLKNNEPYIFTKAKYICEYQDYLNFHLTGEMTASINNIAARWHYQHSHGGYPAELLQELEIGELLEKWPSRIVQLGERILGLTQEAADHLGLEPNIPVAQGGADAQIGMIGLGVVRPGATAFVTGSSHLQFGLSKTPIHADGLWGSYENALLPGNHVVEGGQASTGSIVNWFKNLLGDDIDYSQLDSEAAELSPGSNGLIVLDHFQGARTPNTDSNSRGAITGLSLNHTRAHIFRAIMESVAFGSEQVLETMRKNGFDADQIVIAGGVTRSDLWLQIHADVSGTELKLTKVPDAPALGCAILAAYCAGEFDSIAQAADQMVHITRVIEPDMSAHEEYQDAYQSYKRAYSTLKQIRRDN